MRIRDGALLTMIATVVVVALAGCGGSSKSSSSPTSSGAPSATTGAKATTGAPAGASTPAAGAMAFMSALGNRNPTAVCNAFTPAAQQALAAKVGSSCQAYFSKGFANVASNPQAQQQLNAAKNARIVSVKSNGVRARVTVTYTGLMQPESLNLVNTNGSWLVNSFSRTPAG